MRVVPTDLGVSLSAGVSTLAQLWTITRRDGAVFGFTDHDTALVVDALTFHPGAARGGVIEKSVGLNVDNATVSGALSSSLIEEDALAAGVWDGARVDVALADWRDPSLRVHVFRGQWGDVRRGEMGFEAELRGMQAPLNKSVGRVFSRYCDADVGDARCGVDLISSAFSGSGVVVEVIEARLFRASGLDAFAESWFSRGALVWNVGGRTEVLSHRADASGVWLEILDGPGGGVSVGAGFVVSAGCDKSCRTCADKFSNIVNFRGYPHMPGTDAIQSSPDAGDLHDGSSRWR